jgi:hypothetical protein
MMRLPHVPPAYRLRITLNPEAPQEDLGAPEDQVRVDLLRVVDGGMVVSLVMRLEEADDESWPELLQYLVKMATRPRLVRDKPDGSPTKQEPLL